MSWYAPKMKNHYLIRAVPFLNCLVTGPVFWHNLFFSENVGSLFLFMGFSKQNNKRKCPGFTGKTHCIWYNQAEIHPSSWWVGCATCSISQRSLSSGLRCTVMEGLTPSPGATATKVISEDDALMVRTLPLLSPECKVLCWVGFVVSSEIKDCQSGFFPVSQN